MSSRRNRGGSRRNRQVAEEHHGPDERWMASYMDMVTVLMCLFIVLFAMSSVDQEKFEKLKASLATGFGSEKSVNADVAEGIIVPEELIGSEGLLSKMNGDSNSQAAIMALANSESEALKKLQKRIEKKLDDSGHKGAAKFSINQRGLVIRLVSANTFFESNSAKLTKKAQGTIESIGPVLASTDRQFEIEGYADELQPVAPFPTNWELSSSRATGVLRSLVEDGGVKSNRISSSGYGDSRPLKGVKDISLNRRVDIVVLSSQPDAVRNLISNS